MISILFRLARTTIWCIDLWQNRTVRRQLPPVLGLCLLMGAPAWAQPRVVTLDDAETGSLMFTTTEPGEYVAAPNVRTVVEMEVTGAAVLEGTSMEQVLSEDIPIFAGLLQTTGGHGQTKTLIAPLRDRHLLEPIGALFKELGVDFADPEVGRLFSLPVDFYRGPDITEER